MEKVFREVRCVSIANNEVKFIPENLVKKPGYLDKHGLMVQELEEKQIESKVVQPEIVEPKEPAIKIDEEVKKEPEPEAETKENTTKKTGKIKVEA